MTTAPSTAGGRCWRRLRRGFREGVNAALIIRLLNDDQLTERVGDRVALFTRGIRRRYCKSEKAGSCRIVVVGCARYIAAVACETVVFARYLDSQRSLRF